MENLVVAEDDTLQQLLIKEAREERRKEEEAEREAAARYLGGELFIVDYDVPVEKRKRFYRALRAAIAEYLWVERSEVKSLTQAWELARAGGAFVRSTQSVIVTDDERLARTVYNIASSFGRANLYRAEKVM